ncbi:tubulin-specific chaperone [Strigomonas culicis]|uniref:Tubulin-specific chaperone n=1 Tax=Strigomonas culicis TaxID=28005 RepID=S9W5X0_9TRYP|nr:tubulin-specific chaperone [Strigomonas culicis]|eukprot:EPY31325.1 tubulin-specific chaperone [Strigomonas culicis]
MSTIVKVQLTVSTSGMAVSEKRYGLTQTIQSIKENAYTHFAVPADRARLELYDDRGVKVESDMEDSRPLGYYQCRDDFRIHVVDLQPPAQQENYTDVSQVEKFEISEEEWLRRGDNMRAFKQKMQEQQRAEMAAAGIAPPAEITDESYQEAAAGIHVGDRCMCAPGTGWGRCATWASSGPSSRGTGSGRV